MTYRAPSLHALGGFVSATAAAPELAAEWGLTDAETAWLTVAVQLGFVAGALLSSVLTLSDVFRPRHLRAGSTAVGAACTAAIAALVGSLTVGSALPHLIRAVGGVGAGSASDRLGRTRVTSASMGISGLACLAAGVVFGRSLAVLVPFALVWGSPSSPTPRSSRRPSRSWRRAPTSALR